MRVDNDGTHAHYNDDDGRGIYFLEVVREPCRRRRHGPANAQ